MLIVCEGSVTEPEYFAVLRKMALENEIWAEVEIRPKPRSEAAAEEDVPAPHKSPRGKRPLKIVPVQVEADETELRYPWRQTPVNFVKEARGGLKDDVFEEAWAVFDRNGHPAHAQAFNLAREPINGRTVNIAFSSIAFEHWILLHFERNDTPFVKSECKDQEGRYLVCGAGLHDDDCWGARCVSGYLRVNRYATGSTKIRDDDFQVLLNRLIASDIREKAYVNAAWLRYNVAHNEAEPYLTNPYTNMDALVKRLLGEDSQTIEWTSPGQAKDWQSLRIQIDVGGEAFKIIITNLGQTTRLFNGVDIAVFLSKDEHKSEWLPTDKTNGVIAIDETKTFIPELELDFQRSTLEITTGNHRLLLSL